MEGAQQEVRQHQFIQWYIAAFIQGLYKGYTVHQTGLTVSQGCSQVSTGLPPSPELWCQPAWGEVRGQISEAVTADGAGTDAVETGMAPPVQDMQKTGRRPEKQFLDHCWAAPEEEKAEKPVGLQSIPPLWRGIAWTLAWRSAVASQAARCGFRAGLEAADGDDLILPPCDGEGAGSMPQDCIGAVIGAVERRDDAPAAQPDKGGEQQLIWQLGRQLDVGIVPGQGKRRSIQSFYKFLTIA